MRLDQEITHFVHTNYPRLGVNKSAQIIRLLYEITKRDRVDFRTLLPDIKSEEASLPDFKTIKAALIQRRFPTQDRKTITNRMRFKKLQIDPEEKADTIQPFAFSPQTLVIEDAAQNTPLAVKVIAQFPYAKIKNIPRWKDYVQKNPFSVRTYNQRRQTLFLIKEEFDYVQACPCSRGSVRCGYYNLKLGTGCPYECTYCFLQAYTNTPGICLPVNIEDFFACWENSREGQRLGSGQFTDSLALDEFTGYSALIVDFFRQHPESFFEFKTKSANISLLLKTAPAANILVSWSVNPQAIIDTQEFYTASLEARLNAAARCANHGYSVGFHFDPIILFPGWESAYQAVVRAIFDRVPKASIRWISLGCLRMTWTQKQVIESRFPESDLLNGELLLDYDEKLRYPREVRKSVYAAMLHWIRNHSPKTRVYLCMEEAPLFAALGLEPTAF